MFALVREYRAACEAAAQQPDLSVLAPILKAFEKLREAGEE